MRIRSSKDGAKGLVDGDVKDPAAAERHRCLGFLLCGRTVPLAATPSEQPPPPPHVSLRRAPIRLPVGLGLRLSTRQTNIHCASLPRGLCRRTQSADYKRSPRAMLRNLVQVQGWAASLGFPETFILFNIASSINNITMSTMHIMIIIGG